MARFNEDQIKEAFKPMLEPGEIIKNCAWGVKQPPIWLIVILMLLAILPGAIAVALLTKQYIIALTDRRFMVAEFGGKLKIKKTMDYPLDKIPPVKASTGPLFSHIKIIDQTKPFVAKFHRMGMTNNRENCIAISETLTQLQKTVV